MLRLVQDLNCELFHSRWAEVVSYSRQGAWRCAKPKCAAQTRRDHDAPAGKRARYGLLFGATKGAFVGVGGGAFTTTAGGDTGTRVTTAGGR